MAETTSTEIAPASAPEGGMPDGPPAYVPRAERSDRPPRRDGGRGGGGGRDFRTRRKVCAFCVDKTKDIEYKDTGRLRRFLSDRGKIEPRRKTGTCAKHQRRLSVALKRARFMALLPYTGEHLRSVDPRASDFRSESRGYGEGRSYGEGRGSGEGRGYGEGRSYGEGRGAPPPARAPEPVAAPAAVAVTAVQE